MGSWSGQSANRFENPRTVGSGTGAERERPVQFGMAERESRRCNGDIASTCNRTISTMECKRTNPRSSTYIRFQQDRFPTWPFEKAELLTPKSIRDRIRVVHQNAGFAIGTFQDFHHRPAQYA